MSDNIQKLISGKVEVKKDEVVVRDKKSLQGKLTDELVMEAMFGSDEDKRLARWLIWEIAQSLKIYPSSINDLYMAKGKGKVPLDFSIPAMNLRGMSYDMARAVFATAKKMKAGAIICELARSEMGYTSQPPEEYATSVLAAAIREGWKYPVFLQGDHFQAKAKSPGVAKEGEVETIKNLIKEAIQAGFYNIDIDTSTLVDTEKKSEDDQQKSNIKYSLEFARHVRRLEPSGFTISLGGEIGHIGGENSTVEDLNAYMEGFSKGLPKGMVGMSKISIQTGTSHGGVVLPDGSLADVDVDFSVLAEISKICREKYSMGGAVQHGASTLPDEYFAQFPKSQTLEVHLATGFQNIMMDHPKFPKGLLRKMYTWLDKNKQDERKESWTDEQFHYKLRKKAWGEFKKESWQIDEKMKREIRKSLKKRFEFMFKSLNVGDTHKWVKRFVKPPKVSKKPSDFGIKSITGKQVKGLAD